MKIDIFTHITPEKFWTTARKKYPSLPEDSFSELTTDIILRTMERCPEVLQVITSPPIPPIEALMTPADEVEFSQILNDEMAELVFKYPDKFLGAVACLPLQDMDTALEEADRAITQLGFKGVLVVSRLYGDQLGHPKYRPLYQKMVDYDLPVWIHPSNSFKLDEDKSPDSLEVTPYGLFAWPLATANNMMNLVTEGIFNDYPSIKFITHHCGGVMPMLDGRLRWLYARTLKPGHPVRNKWKEHFRKFYNDTATMGSTASLMCGYDFFGAEHLLFGTDGLTVETIKSVNRMDIPDTEKEMIFSQNAIDLLNLAT